MSTPQSFRRFVAAALGTLCASLGAASGLSGCTTTANVDSASAAEALFASAESLAKDERFEEAALRFEEVKNKHPYNKLATEAELRIADLHFKREAFVEAQSAYQIFKEFHPKHPRVDYVTFQIGMSHFNQLPGTVDRDLTSAERAIVYFDEVISTFPSSEYAPKAREKRQESLTMLAEKEKYIADFYFRQGQFVAALRRYEALLRTYPGMDFSAAAMLAAARSADRTGDRERALSFARQILKTHPNSSEAGQAKNEFGQL